MNLILGLFCACLLLTATSASAQQPPGPDPLGQYIFPPELVMQHQQEIGLTEEQKNFIKGELQRATARFNELQWQIQEEMETMVSLIREATVDEQRVLAQLDKILNVEREIKRTHLTLAIRIKNRLTPEQQARLQAIKRNPGQR